MTYEKATCQASPMSPSETLEELALFSRLHNSGDNELHKCISSYVKKKKKKEPWLLQEPVRSCFMVQEQSGKCRCC